MFALWSTLAALSAPEKEIEMRPLSELAGQQGPIAILCNGPSLPVDRLYEIIIPTLGMNRTWRFRSRYYLVLEAEWLSVDFQGEYFLNATTFVPKKRPQNHARGFRVPLSYSQPYSDSIDAGFFPASTGYLALQIVRAFGYEPIHFLGLDLGGPHFDGSDCWSGMAEHQNKYFRIAAELLPKDSVFICESPESRCDAFPHSGWEDVA